jgi:hypothetical protein
MIQKYGAPHLVQIVFAIGRIQGAGQDLMVREFASALLLSTGLLFAQSSAPTNKSDLTRLFNYIWRITSPTPYPNSSSIFIFLPSGTLLETSCVETYRIATWKTDPNRTHAIEVTEDGRPAFTATILAINDTHLRLRQTLAIGDRAVKEISLTAINKEFTCPDMPK